MALMPGIAVRALAGRVAYGAIFVVVLPLLLVAWARGTAPVVHSPVVHAPVAGVLLAVTGAALVGWGWHALWRLGGGLPMNAFPPPRLVTGGPYRLLAHPIYVGFCAVCLGVSVAAGSASGLWLVCPAVVLGAAALVLGHERQDLQSRFGPGPAPCALPAATDATPTVADRGAVYVLVLLPWALLAPLVGRAAAGAAGATGLLPGEGKLPVWQSTEALHASVYLALAAAPLVARTRADLRRFAVGGLVAMAVVFPLHLLVPLASPARSFVPQGALGALLACEIAWRGPAAAFPSFDAIWALAAGEALASRLPGARGIRAWAVLACASCVTTGRDAAVSVAAGVLVFLAVNRRAALWQRMRNAAERIAGSWREWRLGPLRIINHGGWAALAGGGGVLVAGALAGPRESGHVLLVAIAGLVGSGLWAQLVEGSSGLLRPFGFYGALVGASAGVVVAGLDGADVWLLLAAFAAAAPWIQAVGRLRCLVQGCCHGYPTLDVIGIRYTHPRSRVTRHASLAGRPLHPTPLYSILWNGVTAAVLARLWSLHAPETLVAGSYLLANGLGRFVEEAYRGEPQTPIVARLRFYQWIAVAEVVIGAFLTTVGSRPVGISLAGANLPAAIGFGVACWLALGVDLPASNRRFSRLA